MLGRFWCGYVYRTFSTSRACRNLGKVKPPESVPPKSDPSSQSILDTSMNFAPTEFDKKLLLLSGKFKSREEIPDRIRFDTMDNAKSRLRIRISNMLMIATVLSCVVVIFIGKKRQKKGDSILRRQTEKDEKIKAEAHSNKPQ